MSEVAEVEVVSDTGLGLDEFLGSGDPQEGSSEEAEVEAKEENPSPEEAESKDEEKEVSVEAVGEVSENADDSEDEKEDKEEVKDTDSEKPSLDYESDDNPYIKRQKDTSTYANSLNMENAQLKTEVKQLKQQIEDPYGEQGEIAPSPEEIQADADYKGREKASFATAKEKYGEKYIIENIEAPDSKFQQLWKENPLISIRVNNSETPYLEAVNILKEEEFFSEHGREPESIKASIRKGIESDIRKEVTKEFQDKLKAKEKLPTDIGEVRSSSVETTKEEAFKPDSIDSILS